MMKHAAILLPLTCLVGLSACTTVGNGEMKVLTQKSTGQLLVPGQTKRAEVERSLGQGKAFHFDSGYEVWVYEFRGKQGLPQWVNYVPLVGLVTTYVPRKPTEKELRILFDQQGIVQKWLLLTSPAT
jgi:outer membrane protein assembly factor BamE (lipoprotein component of BamABCDE complex)